MEEEGIARVPTCSNSRRKHVNAGDPEGGGGDARSQFTYRHFWDRRPQVLPHVGFGSHRTTAVACKIHEWRELGDVVYMPIYLEYPSVCRSVLCRFIQSVRM